MKSLFLFIFFIGAMACKNKPQPVVINAGTANEFTSFGESITADNAKTPAEVVAMMATSDSIPVKITGKVTEVCQARGCWMNIVNTRDTSLNEPFFVQFKDYGFFMPKDCAGKTVIAEGIAYKDITSVKELQHYAKDKGASQAEIDAIKEPKAEYKFMAKGVLLDDKKM